MTNRPYVKLEICVRKLVALLDDPEPGFFTWHEMVLERWREINDMWSSKCSNPEERKES